MRPFLAAQRRALRIQQTLGLPHQKATRPSHTYRGVGPRPACPQHSRMKWDWGTGDQTPTCHKGPSAKASVGQRGSIISLPVLMYPRNGLTSQSPLSACSSERSAPRASLPHTVPEASPRSLCLWGPCSAPGVWFPDFLVGSIVLVPGKLPCQQLPEASPELPSRPLSFLPPSCCVGSQRLQRAAHCFRPKNGVRLFFWVGNTPFAVALGHPLH
nr:uncharacterized protein LOC102451466 [Pelodiscus sinensis]|eukprot:XP_025033901.1 uncharacterized protein LOC102451466 [Pelodiscus sinensis]